MRLVEVKRLIVWHVRQVLFAPHLKILIPQLHVRWVLDDGWIYRGCPSGIFAYLRNQISIANWREGLKD
jgi:hypothetical protein